MAIVSDGYAGEAAWREWFKRCAVARCGAENAAKLRKQIEHAMFARLRRCGFDVADAGGDDPVAFFDGYFMLKGSRDKSKPLKSYFAHRIAADGVSMLNFVCGTLFGAGAGRVHDIVIDWIARRLLEKVSRKTKTEKTKVALLLYATAQNVSITEAAVLEGLKTEKSRAYAIREKAMTALRKELKDTEGADDPLFVRMLLETCEAELPEGVLAELGGAR